MRSIHVHFIPSEEVRQRLDSWKTEARHGVGGALGPWTLAAVWSAARSATVAASTAIEGNSLTPEQVDAVLGGAQVDADPLDVRDIANYNAALNIAQRAADRGSNLTEDLIQEINAAVTAGLRVDTGGRYREDEVHVGIYEGPAWQVVPALMAELVDHLTRNRTESTPIRSALVHLNLVAIHPFVDGNGRTARILSSFELMRDGIDAPELIAIEGYIRSHQDEYVDALRTTLGVSYNPEEHPATPWIGYYTRMSLDRLDARNRLLAALPNDFGVLAVALVETDSPLAWVPFLLAARNAPLRTSRIADATGRSNPAVRAMLSGMARAGWLRPVGSTRGRHYLPSDRLSALDLRSPEILRALAGGSQLPEGRDA
jgi:hypothetical protein